MKRGLVAPRFLVHSYQPFGWITHETITCFLLLGHTSKVKKPLTIILEGFKAYKEGPQKSYKEAKKLLK